MRDQILPRRWLHRLRLSLRTLIIVVLVLGGGLGWFAHLARQAQIQRDAVTAVRTAGGAVHYDWPVDNDKVRVKPGTNIISYDVPGLPKWLVDRLGPDVFGEGSALPGGTPPYICQECVEFCSSIFQHRKIFGGAEEHAASQSYPFFAAKKAQARQAAVGRSFEDTCDAAADILRRLMEHRRALLEERIDQSLSSDGPAGRSARCRLSDTQGGPSADQPVYPSFSERGRLKPRLAPALAVAVMSVTVLGSLWFVNAWGQQPAAADHHNRGVDFQAQGKLGDAIAEYRAAIRLKPDFAEVHTRLGNALADRGELEEAIAEFRTAIRLKPDYVLAHYNLGTTLAARRMLDEAIVELHAAARLKPDFAEAHSNLGLALRNQGKLDEAIAEFHTAIRLKPDSAEVHYNLGLALRDQGKEEEAVAEFRRARVNAPRGSKLARAIERALAASDQ